MNRSRSNALHIGQLGGIHVVCDPKLTDEVKSYFSENDLPLSQVLAFSIEPAEKLKFIFDLAKESQKVARVLMGLFTQKPDIEIVMHCCTADGNPQNTTIVKLKHTDDVEKCERLLEKCAQISLQTPPKSGD